MTCIEFDGLIAAYLDCSMDSRTAWRFYAHLNTCQDCVSYLLTYRTVVKLVKEERRIA